MLEAHGKLSLSTRGRFKGKGWHRPCPRVLQMATLMGAALSMPRGRVLGLSSLYHRHDIMNQGWVPRVSHSKSK